eukprot:scaffold4611_cov117-Skeletonema_marinoi.AAC.6
MGQPAFQSMFVTLSQDSSLTLRLRLPWLAPSDAFECTQMHFGLPFFLAFSLQRNYETATTLIRNKRA